MIHAAQPPSGGVGELQGSVRRAILDTSIYIGHWDRGLYEELLASVRRSFIVIRRPVK